MDQAVARPKAPILVVEDDARERRALCRLLERQGYGECLAVSCARELYGLIESSAAFGLAIIDLVLPDADGVGLIPMLRSRRPEAPVIVLTGNDQVHVAVQCMKAGAADFIVKAGDPGVFLNALNRCVARASGVESRCARERMIGDSRATEELRSQIRLVAGDCEPVLVTGETGTGKELVAEAIHEESGRRGGLIKVNIAGLDESLFSDTLFGHAKGAYTGADDSRRGLVREAAGGSLFLDEIGDLSPALQVKLLRLIENGEYYSGGSDKLERSDARIICSTHADLDAAAAEGRFRFDLLYRLKFHSIHVLPLRERPDDIAALARSFWAEAAARYGKERMELTDAELEHLMSRKWLGNVRELRAYLMDSASRGTGLIRSRDVLDPEDGASVAFGAELPRLGEISDILVAEALERSGGNQAKAARMLGVSRQALSKRMERQRGK